MAAHGEVDAAYACHPSLVAIPGDFEPVTKPLSLALGDKDSLLDNNSVGQIQDLMAKKTGLDHELRIYEDQIHGFALRSDWSSDKDRKAMDDSEKQGVEVRSFTRGCFQLGSDTSFISFIFWSIH